jgi:hypothetical protein
MGAGVFIRQPARSHQVFEPAGPPALRPGFGPPEKITFRYDSDEAALLVDHGQTADMPPQHNANGLQDGAFRLDRYDRRCHYIPDFHSETPFSPPTVVRVCARSLIHINLRHDIRLRDIGFQLIRELNRMRATSERSVRPNRKDTRDHHIGSLHGTGSIFDLGELYLPIGGYL